MICSTIYSERGLEFKMKTLKLGSVGPESQVGQPFISPGNLAKICITFFISLLSSESGFLSHSIKGGERRALSHVIENIYIKVIMLVVIKYAGEFGEKIIKTFFLQATEYTEV